MSDDLVVREARRVTWIGFWVNAVLAVLKILAGLIGRSGAMIADGVHSFSDFVTDVTVIVMVGISHREASTYYRYGHGKYETFATLLISVALFFVAVGILCTGIDGILVACRGEQLARPGYVALIMAVVSIVAKEVLFRYTVSRGKAINSSAVIANAWHHRSDAISSLATLVGIFGAMFFGEHWRILDPIAAVVVSIFICIVAVKIGLPALRELLEVSLPISDVKRMEKIIGETPGVKAFHNLRTRKNGYNTIADFHIKVDADIRVVEAHDIATLVENRLKDIFGKYMIVNIHIEPYKGEKREQNGKVDD